jgi:hypothetical protein
MADSITSCAVAQIKAYRALQKLQVNEATRACAAGFSGHAALVDAETLSTATNKFAAAAQQAIAKFGPTNCYFEASQPIPSPSSIIEGAQRVADDLCEPPTPTVTPTP